MFLLHKRNDIPLRTSCQLSPLTNSSKKLFSLVHTFTTKKRNKSLQVLSRTCFIFENYNTIPTCDSVALIAREKVIEWNPLPGKVPSITHLISHFSTHSLTQLESQMKQEENSQNTQEKEIAMHCCSSHLQKNLGVKTSFFYIYHDFVFLVV